MNEKLAEALGYVDEKYVSAAAKRKKRKHYWIVAVAAVLALVLVLNTPRIPLIISAKAVSVASHSRKPERPRSGSDSFRQWYEDSQRRDALVQASMAPVVSFSTDCAREILTGVDTTNRVWSPVNAYIALAITAELTGGETRQQVMEVLGVNSLEELRTRISTIWEQVYRDDGKEISVLANSLWLDKDVDYHQDTMDALAYHYYTSVYQGDLGSERTNKDIANWLRNQTGGLFSNRTGKVDIGEDAMLALASTVYFQSQWSDKFSKDQNTQQPFHTVEGDVTCTFLNKEGATMNYYWGETFGAVEMELENETNVPVPERGLFPLRKRIYLNAIND